MIEFEDQTATAPSGEEPEPGADVSVGEKTGAGNEGVSLPDGFEALPPDPNNKNPDFRLYRYRNNIVPSFYLSMGFFIEQLEQFKGRRSDVIVASFPKSGTTWVQEMVWCATHHNELTNGKGSGIPLEFRFPILELRSLKGVVEMLPLQEITGPRFIKTHLPYHMLPESIFTSGAKVLYVSRDARDVCVSYYHFSRSIMLQMYRGTFEEYRDRFMHDEVVCGPYREHVKGYLDHSDTVLCLKYEEMHQDRASVVRNVADFLSVALTDADVNNIVRNTSFEVMKMNPDTNFRHWEKNGMFPHPEEGTFMRKGVVGDWKNYFTEKENEAFMKWRDEEL